METKKESEAKVFLFSKPHWPDHCDIVTNVQSRKEFLKRRGLWFKCEEKHLVKDCRKRGCFQCKGSHHVSIHKERKQRNNVLAPIAGVSGDTFPGDCVMPLI